MVAGNTIAMSKADAVAGVVLAAGAGSRYGMPKVLAAEGQWLDRAVAALDGGGCDDVIVVLGAAVVDGDGLNAAGDAEWIVLHTVDTPDVGADAVARVLGAARGSRSGLARAVYDGRPGHPVVVARRHLAALAASLHGDQGARSFLAGRDDVSAVECGDLATGVDIDER
ncbi:putative MobA-like protein [Mycolicibacterium conceptionense]|uniref:Putative MobA-like protein n=1 Tax=Mycolicibacterium conceptionense TaxID=451644 RepID=A0A0U1D1E1_9MYCO|nr:putative MobA-like protein [Mycolicibacterium conceptionense]